MKIIIPNLRLPYFENMGRCLKTISSKPGVDIEVILWNPQIKSIVDMFDEIRPDIVFMHEQLLRPEFNMMLQEFDCRYILATGRPYQELHRPPAVILTNETSLSAFDQSDKIMVTSPAADVISMRAAQRHEKTLSDILILTHPNIQFEDNMLLMIDYLCSTYQTKIIGDNSIDNYHYLGKVNVSERANFIKSTRLLIDFGSYDFLDASLLKTPSLLYGTRDAKFKNFQTLKELKEHTDDLLEDEIALEKYADQCYRQITEGGATYYNHCSALFTLLEETHIASALTNTLKELIS